MRKQVKAQTKDKKRDECQCCGYETELELYDFKHEDEGGWYCDLCAGTLASTYHAHPSTYLEATTLATICYVGNAIIEAIKTRKDK